MSHRFRHLNLSSKHIFLNIRIIAAISLNTCTAHFTLTSASQDIRRFTNRLIIKLFDCDLYEYIIIFWIIMRTLYIQVLNLSQKMH